MMLGSSHLIFSLLEALFILALGIGIVFEEHVAAVERRLFLRIRRALRRALRRRLASHRRPKSIAN